MCRTYERPSEGLSAMKQPRRAKITPDSWSRHSMVTRPNDKNSQSVQLSSTAPAPPPPHSTRCHHPISAPHPDGFPTPDLTSSSLPDSLKLPSLSSYTSPPFYVGPSTTQKSIRARNKLTIPFDYILFPSATVLSIGKFAAAPPYPFPLHLLPSSPNRLCIHILFPC